MGCTISGLLVAAIRAVRVGFVIVRGYTGARTVLCSFGDAAFPFEDL